MPTRAHLPDARTDPWLGYGIGLESATFEEDTSERDASRTFRGFEVGHLMGGVDFRLSERLGLGPFLDFSLGRYNYVSTDIGGSESGQQITNQADHYWFAFGARAVIYP